jgi:hypothetical protein
MCFAIKLCFSLIKLTVEQAARRRVFRVLRLPICSDNLRNSLALQGSVAARHQNVGRTRQRSEVSLAMERVQSGFREASPPRLGLNERLVRCTVVRRRHACEEGDKS